MLSKNIETALNNQIRIEAESSQIYLSMACWAEAHGLEGIAQFMYAQSDEERAHMLKLIKYVNERGGHTQITDLKAPISSYETFQNMFEELYKHEIFVSNSINELVHITFSEKDYATHNFLQWYVAEQIEEEATAKSILDKINLIGDDKGGLYLFDRDIQQVAVANATKATI
ncbi:ferritin [Flavobacterium succinicans]|jgi:ferritin|uniref:Ferritin n=1 Tax=Flavobacterium succinicans TaxID=29536 RepID=A0A1I4V0S3_9FLAO|nr:MULTISPECIES: ferritin [Flavobacterium]OOV28463.1 ferritin [Flavobacterium sp. LM5]SFM94788.1 ferritin [Flavobacterium succinicans]